MELHNVAARFDLTPMWDAYSGKLLKAKCQITAWDNTRRDGMTTVRRTLFVKQGTKFPRRHTVVVGGQAWILARLENLDTWGRHNTRIGYVAQYADLGRVGQTDEVLQDKCEEVYVSRVWVKDVKDISTTSEAQGQYYIYFTHGENIKEGGFVFVMNRWHIVRNLITGTAGLMIAECNELESDCLTEIHVINSGVYNPVSETYDNAQELKIKALTLEWKDDYTHELPSREKEEVGDKRLRISSQDAAFINEATQFKWKDVLWQVSNIETRRDKSLSVAIRRV